MDFRYNGVINLTPDVKKIFGMQPDMKTVPFGFSSKRESFCRLNPNDAGL